MWSPTSAPQDYTSVTHLHLLTTPHRLSFSVLLLHPPTGAFGSQFPNKQFALTHILISKFIFREGEPTAIMRCDLLQK